MGWGDPRPRRLWGGLRGEHPRPTRLPPSRGTPHTLWSRDTGSPDGRLSEKLPPGNFGVPGYWHALGQDTQGQDEI